jgi:hypothetical protein
VAPGSEALGEAAARGLHKVVAHEGEYELARLRLAARGFGPAEEPDLPAARQRKEVLLAALRTGAQPPAAFDERRTPVAVLAG